MSAALSSAEGYDRMAEFHELFMVDAWSALRPAMESLFGGLTASDTLVEVGAGSGLGVALLAAQSPCRIICLEPDLVMRSMLMSRVAGRPDLKRRVTVHAGAAPGSLDLLPEVVHGFVCAHMLGHLTVAERRSTFAWFGQHLDPNGVGMVTFDPARHFDGPVEESVTVGDLTYREVHVPNGPEGFRTIYTVWHHDRLLRTEEVAGTWQSLSADTLIAELREGGLRAEPIGGSALRVGRLSPPEPRTRSAKPSG